MVSTIKDFDNLPQKDDILSYDGVDCNVKENHELSYQNVQQRESDQEAQGDRLYLRMRKWSKILHSGKKLVCLRQEWGAQIIYPF